MDENPAMSTRATLAKVAAINGDGAANGNLNARAPARRRAVLEDLSNVSKVQAAKASALVSVKPADTNHSKTADASIKTRAKNIPTSTLNSRRAVPSNTHIEGVSTSTKAPSNENGCSHASSILGGVSNGLKNGNYSSSSSLHESHKPIHAVRSSDSSSSTSSTSLKRNLDELSEDRIKAPAVDDDYFVEEAVVPRTAKRPRTQTWDDLDTEDYDDPLMVAEYTEDIFEHLHSLEQKYMPNPDYIDDQTELEWQQRGLLMDWIVEIHSKLHLLPETLFLAANIIDRFMTLRVVNLDKIQLVGVTALLLAAKYEEVFPPVLHYFAYLTGGNFDETDILSAEKFVLQVLEFELSYPNPLNFLRRISKADDYNVQSRSFGKYLLECSMVENSMLQFPPSIQAAAAMYVSRHILGRPEWNANLVHYSGDISESSLRPAAVELVKYLASPVEHEALFKKYASRRYYKASLVARQWAKANRSHFLL